MTDQDRPPLPLVIGVGNPDRGDDGIGPVIVETIRERHGDAFITFAAAGDLSDLVLRWEADQHVIVVDAMTSGRPPGTVVCLDALRETLPTDTALVSSHGIGLGEAIELGRHLGRLPATLLVFAVESATFEHFAPLSAPVESAIPHVVAQILECAQS